MSNSTIKPSEEAVDDGKNHYISTFEYIGSLEDLNLNLKCEVVHKGYKEEQLDQFENIVKAKFNIPKQSPIDCELGPWNECNVTCGTGIQSRIIVKEALYAYISKIDPVLAKLKFNKMMVQDPLPYL